ncbi:hypothetical protein chiPu_0010276 [Chiloscyllium punctatum]|uniref:Uncharacterized protein n=1 Tax=Chiloscyllium punctatum TaxID=137246 RepID=A0A401SN42_CHIPU|nr:hypothetical protein [Chiloscyllium punctatum]
MDKQIIQWSRRGWCFACWRRAGLTLFDFNGYFFRLSVRPELSLFTTRVPGRHQRRPALSPRTEYGAQTE